MSDTPLHIIKIGGQVIDDPETCSAFLEALVALPGHKILVHGGGKMASRLTQQLHIQSQMHQGRRITDTPTLQVVTMVYAGWINKNLVAQLHALGCPAIGLSGADANALQTQKRPPTPIDFGWVGDPIPEGVNTDWITDLLIQQKMLPVFCAITHDGQGQLLNTNADTIAATLATALAQRFAVRLTFCFEKSGVLLDPEDDNSCLPRLTQARYRELIAEGRIAGGMIPKLDNAFATRAAGVAAVRICSATDLQNPNAGTAINP
ncbi:MAG: acetylglutamate kinase [Bernardetiaceae bacterium]